MTDYLGRIVTYHTIINLAKLLKVVPEVLILDFPLQETLY